MKPVDAVRIDEALGQSEAFLTFQANLSQAAKVDRPVLLIGERGTGKELAAKRIHYLSTRWQEPFITLNSAAMTPSLITSELFGHDAGAFTGAVDRRTGRFEAADGGTLFLDEIGLIPIEAQEKILRIVEYGTFERVGSSKSTAVDVRIVGATNADLPAMADQGTFKKDLLDRLSFEVLFLPPLRERAEDIGLLARHFAVQMAVELGRTEPPQFSPRAQETLEAHPWPGNIRELKNAVERAVYRATDSRIRGIELDPFRRIGGLAKPFGEPEAPVPAAAGNRDITEPSAPLAELSNRPFKEAIRELELGLLKRALSETNYHQKSAAHRLGLSYHQFRGLYRKYKDVLD